MLNLHMFPIENLKKLYVYRTSVKLLLIDQQCIVGYLFANKVVNIYCLLQNTYHGQTPLSTNRC